MALSLTVGILLRVAVIRTDPSRASAEVIVRVFPDFTMLTLELELVKQMCIRDRHIAYAVLQCRPVLHLNIQVIQFLQKAAFFIIMQLCEIDVYKRQRLCWSAPCSAGRCQEPIPKTMMKTASWHAPGTEIGGTHDDTGRQAYHLEQL